MTSTKAKRQINPPDCEDCGDDPVIRRRRCHHCGMMVCVWCFYHVHDCTPGHTRETCRDLKAKAESEIERKA